MTDQNEILKLRHEILRDIESFSQKKKKLSWDSKLVTGVLLVLAIISVVQVTQSAAILAKVEGGQLSSQATQSASSNSVIPDNLKNLPNMVGGC